MRRGVAQLLQHGARPCNFTIAGEAAANPSMDRRIHECTHSLARSSPSSMRDQTSVTLPARDWSKLGYGISPCKDRPAMQDANMFMLEGINRGTWNLCPKQRPDLKIFSYSKIFVFVCCLPFPHENLVF